MSIPPPPGTGAHLDPRHPDHLLALLPALYRDSDADNGHLQAFLRVLWREQEALRRQLDTDLDDTFIETCAPDVVPRLAALVGVEGPRALLRDYVALALRLHRRKGTPGALADAVSAVTGDAVHLVQGHDRLTAPAHVAAPDVEDCEAPTVVDALRAGRCGSPVHPCARDRQLPRVGLGPAFPTPAAMRLHLWRAEVHSWADHLATPGPMPGSWTVAPDGQATVLHNRPRTDGSHSLQRTREGLPEALRPEMLAGELSALHAGAEPDTRWLSAGAHPPCLAFSAGTDIGALRDIPHTAILLADLSSWTHPRLPIGVPRGHAAQLGVSVGPGRALMRPLPPAVELLVDPLRGRMLQASPTPHLLCTVSTATAAPQLTAVRAAALRDVLDDFVRFGQTADLVHEDELTDFAPRQP